MNEHIDIHSTDAEIVSIGLPPRCQRCNRDAKYWHRNIDEALCDDHSADAALFYGSRREPLAS